MDRSFAPSPGVSTNEFVSVANMATLQNDRRFGFSLVEIILVIAVLALILSIGFGHYRNFQKNVELETAATTLIFNLRNARSRSMAGEQARKWGAHLVNGSSDYYELFSTTSDYASGLVDATTYLSNGVRFTDPGESASKDVIFNAINGSAAANSIALVFEDRIITITITVDGTIY